MMRNKIGAVALAAALLFAPFTTTVAAPSAPPPHFTGAAQDDVPSDAEQNMFTRGQTLYNQGRYEQAAGVLKDFLKSYPNSIITDLTLLWLGRAHMQLGQLREAEQIGLRLRAIRDTPFADIYEGELQSARRDYAERAAESARTPSSTPTPEARPTATPASVAMVTPSPVRPTPTPARPTPSASPTPILVARSDKPRLPEVTRTPPREVARTETTTPPRERRSGRERNRREPAKTTPSPQPPTIDIRPSTSTTKPPPRRQPTPRRNEPREQVAANTQPRTPITMTATPQPTRPVVTSSDPALTMSTPSPVTTTTTPPSQAETTGGLSFTVKQVPNLQLALRNPSLVASPGQPVQVPLVVTNAGNKEDQFRLETDLPAEYQPSFSLAQSGSENNLPILITPQLARGASLDVVLNLRIPETAPDGQQSRFIVSAASQADYQVIRVTDAAITVVAAALAAVSGVSQDSVMPGETFTQTISIRNQGSAAARTARADFVFNPDFELVSANPSPLVYDRASRTAIWSLGELEARNGRNISVTLRAVPDALAASRVLGRGTLRTGSLPVPSNFDGPSINVGRVTRARIDAVSTGLTATPGDTIFVPFVVRNPGNYAESYELRIIAPGAPSATIYADTNGDGLHQESESSVAQTTQLDPRGGQYPLLLRVDIPRSTPDRQQYAYNLVTRSVTQNRVASEASTVLTVAAPRVRLRTEQPTDEVRPGDTFFYRLVLANEGGGLAKNLIVSEQLPAALEFVNSDPSLNPQDAPGGAQRFVWRVAELAPGDTIVLRINVRLRPNLAAETTLQSRHSLTYQDTNGNSYQAQ